MWCLTSGRLTSGRCIEGRGTRGTHTRMSIGSTARPLSGWVSLSIPSQTMRTIEASGTRTRTLAPFSRKRAGPPRTISGPCSLGRWWISGSTTRSVRRKPLRPNACAAPFASSCPPCSKCFRSSGSVRPVGSGRSSPRPAVPAWPGPTICPNGKELYLWMMI